MTAQLWRGEVTPTARREVLRYMKSPGEGTPAVEALVDSVLREGEPLVSFGLVYLTLPVRKTGEEILLGELSIRSEALSRALCACSCAVVFAATAGHALDRLVLRYSRISPARALAASAFGTERVEALCDSFQRFCKSDGRRVSPGYQDLPLSLSRELLAMLGAERTLGVTMTESGLMNPKKTVTAIFGIK